MQDECIACKTLLFLSDQMKWGTSHTIKTPRIKYPYLPLSDQITSLLKIPGIKALLDQWRAKPWNPSKYSDIFNRSMCHLKLRAPDRMLFFSNHPHKKHGPGGELRIGVNLGINWYVYYSLWFQLTKFCCRFSYIHSNIAPSHSSYLTSFSICNLPPGYWYVILGIFVCLAVDFPGTAHQISCAWASFQVQRSRTLTKFNISYAQLFLIFYACGRMVSHAPWSPCHRVSSSFPCYGLYINRNRPPHLCHPHGCCM